MSASCLDRSRLCCRCLLQCGRLPHGQRLVQSLELETVNIGICHSKHVGEVVSQVLIICHYISPVKRVQHDVERLCDKPPLYQDRDWPLRYCATNRLYSGPLFVVLKGYCYSRHKSNIASCGCFATNPLCGPFDASCLSRLPAV